MKKKLLALLFVAMVAMLTFAVSASAATTGALGDNCSYTYDEATGVMTISGSGVLTKTSSIAKNTATKVVIEEGITEIPTAFFFPGTGKTSNLTEVTLPASLTALPKQAFYNCDKLTTVNIPANTQIASIGDKAFVGSAVTSVDFNDNLKTVGAEAFYNCLTLTSADLGNSLTSLGANAFNRCAKLTTVVAGGTYTSIGANTFYACYALEDLTIADTVASIGDGAFRQTKALTEFTVPSALKTIGAKTFRDSAITGTFAIPEGATTIGEQAFFGCANLTTITLPDSITSIGGYCFVNAGITHVSIPESLKDIPTKAFNNCKSLATVELGHNVVTIGNYAFSESGITAIVIPESVTSLGNGAFWGCTALKTVKIDANLQALNSKLFMNCTAMHTANIPETVVNIQPYAFYNCSKLESIEIPAGLKLLYNDAFYNTTALAVDVVIPGTVKTIGDKCFYKSGITGLTLNEGIEAIGATAFREAKIQGEITIPTTCTTIGASAFRQTKVTAANIPASVTSIGDKYIFYGTGEVVLVKTEATAEYVIAWAATASNVTLDTTYVPGGDVEEKVAGVVLNVTVDGTTATATLVIENAPELTSVAFVIAYSDDLKLTAAATALDGFTTDPAIANPVKFVWINGLANADINGTIATFTFEVTEGAEITADDFAITYDADDVCAINGADLVNVELATSVVIG